MRINESIHDLLIKNMIGELYCVSTSLIWFNEVEQVCIIQLSMIYIYSIVHKLVHFFHKCDYVYE